MPKKKLFFNEKMLNRFAKNAETQLSGMKCFILQCKKV